LQKLQSVNRENLLFLNNMCIINTGEILKMVRWKNSVASSIMKKSIVDMDIHVKEKRRNSNES
ncbi:MAG: hypothetical protein KH056_11610, partial [Clostridiales bacterium]|nr:hypothetical protein [Clostridiales bacterium]